jgi:hypothetical protein
VVEVDDDLLEVRVDGPSSVEEQAAINEVVTASAASAREVLDRRPTRRSYAR